MKFENYLLETKPQTTGKAILSTFGAMIAVFVAWIGISVILGIAFKIGVPQGNPNFDIELKFLIIYLLIGFGAGLLALFLYRQKVQNGAILSVLSGASFYRYRLSLVGMALSIIILVGGTLFFEQDYITGTKTRITSLGFDKYLILVLAYSIAFMVQSTFEEVYFRGFFTQLLRRIKIPMIVIIFITSAIFGFAHYSSKMPFGVLFAAFIMGLSFAIAAWRTNGIEISIGAHITNNIIVGGIFGAIDNEQANSSELYLSGALFGLLFLGGLELALRLWPKLLDGTRTGAGS